MAEENGRIGAVRRKRRPGEKSRKTVQSIPEPPPPCQPRPLCYLTFSAFAGSGLGAETGSSRRGTSLGVFHRNLYKLFSEISTIIIKQFTLGLLALSGITLGLGHLLARAESRGRARALAADARRRRTLRRRRTASVFPPPSPEALLAAWERSRDSLSERILLGSLVADLEPALDDELHRRLGLVRRHRGPRRCRSA